MDPHRGPPDMNQRGIERYFVANFNWSKELHCFNGDRRPSSLRHATSHVPSGKVHLGQNPTAKDIAGRVCISWNGNRPNDQNALGLLTTSTF